MVTVAQFRSNPFLNLLVVSAITASSGSLFQGDTTLLEKNFALVLVRCPLLPELQCVLLLRSSLLSSKKCVASITILHVRILYVGLD